MPVSKLKTLAIAILLMANLLLVILIVPSRLAQRQETDALYDSLSSLYARQEISLLPETIPDTVPLYVLELKDSSGQEAAAALLGEELQIHDDSSRYISTYTSPSGSCTFSRSGDFSARLTGQKEYQDLRSASRKLLHKIGFSAVSLPEPQRVRAGVYTVCVTQEVLGMPVFSGDLVLTWSNNRLTEMEGVFFPETASLVRVSDQPCVSAADALVAFLSARYELGWVGSAVTGLQQGYVRSETASAVRLTPVWQLETDTGSFRINGVTGEVTAQ